MHAQHAGGRQQAVPDRLDGVGIGAAVHQVLHRVPAETPAHADDHQPDHHRGDGVEPAVAEQAATDAERDHQGRRGVRARMPRVRRQHA